MGWNIITLNGLKRILNQLFGRLIDTQKLLGLKNLKKNENWKKNFLNYLGLNPFWSSF